MRKNNADFFKLYVHMLLSLHELNIFSEVKEDFLGCKKHQFHSNEIFDITDYFYWNLQCKIGKKILSNFCYKSDEYTLNMGTTTFG